MIEVKCDRCRRAAQADSQQTVVMRVNIMARCTPVETKAYEHLGHPDLCRTCREKLKALIEHFIEEHPASPEPETEPWP